MLGAGAEPLLSLGLGGEVVTSFHFGPHQQGSAKALGGPGSSWWGWAAPEGAEGVLWCVPPQTPHPLCHLSPFQATGGAHGGRGGHEPVMGRDGLCPPLLPGHGLKSPEPRLSLFTPGIATGPGTPLSHHRGGGWTFGCHLCSPCLSEEPAGRSRQPQDPLQSKPQTSLCRRPASSHCPAPGTSLGGLLGRPFPSSGTFTPQGAGGGRGGMGLQGGGRATLRTAPRAPPAGRDGFEKQPLGGTWQGQCQGLRARTRAPKGSRQGT